MLKCSQTCGAPQAVQGTAKSAIGGFYVWGYYNIYPPVSQVLTPIKIALKSDIQAKLLTFTIFKLKITAAHARERRHCCNSYMGAQSLSEIYFDRSVFLTASRTFSTNVGDTESSSIPIRRNVSVSVVSAASSPQIPIHAPFL